MNVTSVANELIPLLGGKENIVSAAHCATRLRLVLQDDNKINKNAIEQVDGVKGCFSNAGQIQIIFGTGIVNKVYAAVKPISTGRMINAAELNISSMMKIALSGFAQP